MTKLSSFTSKAVEVISVFQTKVHQSHGHWGSLPPWPWLLGWKEASVRAVVSGGALFREGSAAPLLVLKAGQQLPQ